MPPIRYNCNYCHLTLTEAICPRCNRFLTDDVAIAEACMKPIAPPDKPIEWCTAFGHWGDVFCCAGVMRSLMARSGQEKVNVLYVGPDLAIVDWLELQPFINRVMAVKSDNGDFYKKFWGATSRPDSEPEVWLGILWEVMRGLPKAEQFTQTHINSRWFETRTGLPAQLWHGGVLPDEDRMRAGMLLQDALPNRPRLLYHLHPVSTWSESSHNHWAHWLAAIEWLVEKTPHTYVLTGIEEIRFLPQSGRLVNLIGKTKTNLEVLAISDCCDGVISTPNNVAIWSVIARQKCLCVGNLATQFLSSYYRRFLERGDRLTYVNVDVPFSGFQGAACEWLEGE